MNIRILAWKNITSNKLNTILSLLLMTLGVGIISLILLLNHQISQKLENDLRGIDMVVGAKGSPLQLILSSIYHIDNPTGNISFKEINKLSKDPMVDFTIPLSYGDSYNGFRIVGTTHQYPTLYDCSLRKGKLWNKNMQVVLGYRVAQINNLKLGEKFYGTHGLNQGGHVHSNHSYEVVGIFSQSNSVIDNLILTDIKSVWDVHEENTENNEHHISCNHDDIHQDSESLKNHDVDGYSIPEESMITAILVKFKSPIGLMQLPRKVNETTNLQAAIPIFEIHRLTSLIGFGLRTINLIALIIIIVSGLSIFISLYTSLKKRRYELALMRVHGASKWQLVKLILYEGLILSFIGVFLGLIISRLSLLSIFLFIDNQKVFPSFQFQLINNELWLFLAALFIGVLSSLIPSFLTYRMNIPQTLTNE